MKLLRLLSLICTLWLNNAYAVDQVAKEDTQPPAAESALPVESIPPVTSPAASTSTPSNNAPAATPVPPTEIK